MLLSLKKKKKASFWKKKQAKQQHCLSDLSLVLSSGKSMNCQDGKRYGINTNSFMLYKYFWVFNRVMATVKWLVWPCLKN